MAKHSWSPEQTQNSTTKTKKRKRDSESSSTTCYEVCRLDHVEVL
ncbi:predicted protein [Sclerotinia sclerotiorum 1980 UF-70]|uniref:Uncharacterized protein n=1 Tax=Sclerotinia sclerotiorum (strain ATCC 18683 / 1980 / Ss-1) TaxID=665079 RepID=A7F111_SCLS1|nr:predicted protein [Sclerotinia sclerotiorum 1980 UF-70]EDN95403.1 predicted protein [Sclerotinia sclerotiorum 1980 UF-70]